MIERSGMRKVEILLVKNRTSRYFGDKFPFRNAIAVKVSEPRYRLAHDHVEIVTRYVSVLSIEPVFI